MNSCVNIRSGSVLVYKGLILVITFCLTLPLEALEVQDKAPSKLTLRLSLAPSSELAYSDQISIIRDAFSRAKIGLGFIRVPYQRGLQLANKGSLDGDALRIEGVTRQYPNLLPIPIPLDQSRYWVVMHTQASCPKSRAELRQLKFIKLLGSLIHTQASAATGSQFIEIQSPRSFTQVLSHNLNAYTIINRKTVNTAPLEPQPFKTCLKAPLLQRKVYTYLHKQYDYLLPVLAISIREAQHAFNRREG